MQVVHDHPSLLELGYFVFDFVIFGMIDGYHVVYVDFR